MTTIINGTTNAITFPDGTIQTTAATGGFAAGTVMLFYQAAAPTGWTQVTSLDDYDLRLVSGTGGGTGGTTAYSTVFTNQTITISGNTGATTLSTAQMPSHSHTTTSSGANWGTYNPCGAGAGIPSSGFVINNTGTLTGSAGSGSSHTHSMGGSGTVTLNVRYANIIICSKN
jgi:hypothetical protein